MALPKPQTTYAPIGGDTVLTRVQGAVATAFLRLQGYLTQLRDQAEARLAALEAGLADVEVVAAGPLTVEEADGSPAVAGVNTLRFHEADGFVVSSPSAGVARVDLSGVPQAAITNLTTDLAARELVANKGAASGYAGLDAGAKVPTAQLGVGTANSTTYLRGDQTWAALTIPGDLRVEEADGSPSITPVTALQFDAADGFVVSSAGAGAARVDLSGIPQARVTNLTSDLAGKAASVHTHAIADVTSLQTTLDSLTPWGSSWSTTFTTTNNANQDISLPQLPSDSISDIEVVILAYRTGGSRGTGAVGDAIAYRKSLAVAMVGSNAGTPTQFGTSTSDIVPIRRSSDLAAASAGYVSTIMASGGLVQIRVVGATNVDLKWRVIALIRSRT